MCVDVLGYPISLQHQPIHFSVMVFINIFDLTYENVTSFTGNSGSVFTTTPGIWTSTPDYPSPPTTTPAGGGRWNPVAALVLFYQF